MADDSLDQTPKADKDNVDLTSLSSFSLGPNWVSGKKSQTRLPKEAFNDGPKGPRGPRDRRGPPARKRARFDRDRKDSRPPYRERRERDTRPELFKPVLAVDFYPEEEPFKVLSQAIKTSCRTFELFEIARLILDKTDRFVCVARDPEHKEGEPAKLWACVPDGLPFHSEEEAMAHTFRHYMSEFFTVETVEVEAPAGSFQMVHKCGMTGELLAPPNYHRYQAICREHHAAKLSHVPYERFEQRIESTREDEDIQAWLTSMKTQTRYISKENPEQVFENQEDARLNLLAQSKDKLVRPAYSARFSGKSLALLNPGSPIRRSVEFLLEGQKRFPLDTANHLRGRLRRMHFAVYKRGSKGVSFVCAVKRHFRKPDEVLADNLQKLIEFLESRPNFPAKDLPKAYLAKPEAPKEPEVEAAPAEAPVPEAPETPATESVAETEEKPAEVESTDAEKTEEAAPVEEAPAETKPEEATPAEPVAEKPTPEDAAAIKQLKTDLHYLVSQGYVIEYSDGRLFVPPIREDEIRHLEKVKAQAEKAKESAKEEKPVEEKPEKAEETEVPEKVEEPKVAEKAEEPAVAEKTEEPVVAEKAEEAEEPVVEAPAEETAPAETAEEPEPEEQESAATEEPKSDPEPAPVSPEEPEVSVEQPEVPEVKESPEEPEPVEEPEKPEAEEQADPDSDPDLKKPE